MKDALIGKIDSCRICGHGVSSSVIDLGALALTGFFEIDGSKVSKGNMSLTRCLSERCGLLQLQEIYDPGVLYGDHYGYASSLNSSMAAHLASKAESAQRKLDLVDGDIVIDVGSNDGTSLSYFPKSVKKIGVDVVGEKYVGKYEAINATCINDFFPSPELGTLLAGKKARLISSYSCFYDLADPVAFASAVASHLARDGLWILEQSYLGSLINSNSFDTICHEHIEYYRLCDIEHICRLVGLKIIDVSFNDINGGSFSVQVARDDSDYSPSDRVSEVLSHESTIDWVEEIQKFSERILSVKTDLLATLDYLIKRGNKIFGLGASTKGNVLLQYFGLSAEYIEAIGEVNIDKVGRETPGSCIPIIDEKLLLMRKPDYVLILPWHFKQHFVENPKYKGLNLIFPLPYPQIIRT